MNQINLTELAAGEINAGIIMNDGKPDYWLILLAGDNDGAPWDTQMAWAKDQGGDLPTLPELNLLRANAKDQFKQDWYWSNTQHATVSDSAWCQNFSHGYQDYYDKSGRMRARAVRRLPC
jgi:hypothetical protein